MASYQRMLFVCLNDRGEDHPKGSCSRSGGDALLEKLRADLHERGLKRVVRAVGALAVVSLTFAVGDDD